MDRKRALTAKELEEIARKINEYGLTDDSDVEEAFQDSGSENKSESDISSESDLELPVRRITRKRKRNNQQKAENDLPDDEILSVEPNLASDLEEIEVEPNPISKKNIHWSTSGSSFIPSKSVEPTAHVTRISHADITHKSSELEYFLKLVPRSLFIFMAECTNVRLSNLQEKTKKQYLPTDYHEMVLVIGCYFVMAYNKVPPLSNYWSSLGNEAIKNAISRDRFFLLTSKMYYNHPKKIRKFRQTLLHF
ncbi:unnamed protein product [Acanthoscelides obtectus]|uniref:PiggyBac transposable element-derived protein domain-containing protein n=1 Tax=Acanthoscelides obtectus TaxID=200917 RepID=A0A9P0L962_ACAOB|nr:unnamed protein product [Acanthoscelides obtectus]CAK1650775.1 hypothetical protein AOBTE_LOCUS16891 [Acanthoscelides obtectus]